VKSLETDRGVERL